MDFATRLKKIIQNKEVIIYGYGALGGTALLTFHLINIRVSYIIDGKKAEYISDIGGISVCSPEILDNISKDNYIVFVCTEKGKNEVVSILENKHYLHNINYYLTFLESRYDACLFFSPCLGWSRGEKQFYRYKDSLNGKCKRIITLGESTTDYSLLGENSWPFYFQQLCDKFEGGGVRSKKRWDYRVFIITATS